MVTEAQAAAVRVRRGARWLDENFPGWESRIDIDTLELDDEYQCICGQAFDESAAEVGLDSGFHFALNTLFTEANKWINGVVRMQTKSQGLDKSELSRRSGRVSIALGFDAGRVFADHDQYPKSTPATDREFVYYKDLQKAWERLMLKRFKAA